jgi:hypothetical protein
VYPGCIQAVALFNVRRGVRAIVESTTVCRWWYVAGWCSVSSAGGKRLCDEKQKAIVGSDSSVDDDSWKACAPPAAG